ncbi:hypothetical protein GCM10022236_02570 [Microlunatus ginsengisoli]|uniref:Integral membrane bound transporter domain-containing protein n=1 Tax=Microlunatus ginsengisoli TaxID=363863 RepID=A0ABP6ZCF0_9ACTN
MLALPAAVAMPFDTQLGLGAAVGMLPAAAAGVLPVRRTRVLSLVISVVAAISLAIGALIGQHAATAVPGLFVFGFGAALAASRVKGGALAMLLAAPLVGIGLSFAVDAVLGVAVVMVVGGLYAWLVSLLWPERPTAPRPAGRMSTPQAITYGTLLGLAGATAAAGGFAFQLDHKGWICGAALLVMRPVTTALVARGLGRAGSVLLGGLLGSSFIQFGPAGWLIGVAVAVALGCMSATQGSRWYVMPAFTTFVVFILLLWDHPTDSAWRFAERNAETLIGIAIALFYGVLIPLLIKRIPRAAERSRRRPADAPA